MKFIKSKLLKSKRKKKYEITLEVSEYDMLMFEDLATTYSPFKLWEDFKNNEVTWEDFEEFNKYCEFNKKYSRWLDKTWRCFWKLWREYD